MNEKKILVWKIVLIIVLVFLLGITVNKYFFLWKSLKSSDFAPLPFNEAIEKDYASIFENLASEYKNVDSEISLEMKDRDFFFPVKLKVAAAYPYLVKLIVFDSMVFVYKGHIEQSPGVWIAQLDWNNKTKFLKEGDVLDQWTVLQIRENVILLLSDEGFELELPLQKKVFAKEPYAVLVNNETQKESEVRLGEDIDEYKVLDITKSTVILRAKIGMITLNK